MVPSSRSTAAFSEPPTLVCITMIAVMTAQ